MLSGAVAPLICFFSSRLLSFEIIPTSSLNQWLEEKKAHFHIFFIPPIFNSYKLWIHHFMINFTLDCLLSSCSQSGFHLHDVEWNVEEIPHWLFLLFSLLTVVTNIFKNLGVVLYPVEFPTFCWNIDNGAAVSSRTRGHGMEFAWFACACIHVSFRLQNVISSLCSTSKPLCHVKIRSCRLSPREVWGDSWGYESIKSYLCRRGIWFYMCTHTDTCVFLLANTVMFGQLPGNYSKLYPEWELVKNTL